MCQNELYLRALKKEAEKSPINRRCAAMLVYRNSVVSIGYNYHKRGNVRKPNYCVLCG